MLFRNIFRDLYRRKTKTLLIIIVSVLFSVFLVVYQSVIIKNKLQLDSFVVNLPVTGTITNSSGNNAVGLRIDYKFINKLIDSGFISNESYTSFAKATATSCTTPTLQVLPPEAQSKNIFTSNQFSVLESHASTITFFDGYDKDTLYTDLSTCLISDSLYNTLPDQKSNLYETGIYDVRPNQFDNIEYKYIDTTQFKIIGTYISSDSNPNDSPSILCSTETMKSIFDKRSLPFYLDSTKFTIPDPLNMNEFSATMKKLGFVKADMQSTSLTSTSNALVLDDKVFLNAVLPIIKNTNILKLFYIIIFLLIILMGGIISFLGVQSKKDEIAVSRSLGASKKNISIYILLENIITCITGIIIGVLISLLIPTTTLDASIIILLIVYLATYQIGSSISIIQSHKVKITDLLTKAE